VAYPEGAVKSAAWAARLAGPPSRRCAARQPSVLQSLQEDREADRLVSTRNGGNAVNEQDRQHLQLLSVFHYVVGAFVGLFSCFPIIHLVLGIAMVTGAFGHAADQPALMIIGTLFIVMGAIFILCGWSFAALLILAGTYLNCRLHYMFCLVMAGISCAFFPFGTVLGVFTIVVLSTPEVRAAFPPTATSEG
jgi:hypothetical protein